MSGIRRSLGVLSCALIMSGCGGGGGGTESFAVTATAGAGGTVTPSTVTVRDGSTASFTFTANTGYSLTGATGCGGTLSGNTYTTGAITSACTVTGTFSSNTHTVAAVVGAGGTVDRTSERVTHGTTTTLTFTPDDGYQINQVTGCAGTLSGNVYTTGAIVSDCTVSATFAQKTYTVSVVMSAGGSVDKSSATVAHGSTTSFVFTPGTGYSLSQVTGCGGTLSANVYTTAPITASCAVSATFAQVVAPPIAASLAFQASATEAKTNQPVTLTWSSTNATSCAASGAWSGTKATSGSESVNPPAVGDNTFSLQCGAQNVSPASRSVVIRGLPTCTHTNTSDGVLVSTPAQLQTALSNAGGNGRDDVIYIAAGVYKPSRTLVYDAKGTTEKISLIGCAAEDVVFDGQSAIRLFHFQKNGVIGDGAAWQASTIHNPPYPALRMEKLTVQNGDSGADSHKWGYSGGGMLVERYHTELDGVRFVNNKDANEGGAINGVADVSVANSTFVNNSSGGIFGGSAISVCGSVSVANSTFESNGRLALYRGICIEADYSKLPITITGSTFKGNQGALYALGDYGAPNGSLGQLTIADTVFDSNRGTAVVSRMGNVTVTNSEFLNNGFQTADTSQAANCVDYDFFPCTSGGALFIDNWIIGGGVVTIEGSRFIGNYAPNYGGAIAMGGVRDCEKTYSREGAPCNPVVTGFNPEYNLVVKNTSFTGNRSHRGAAIAIAKFPLAKDGFQRGNLTLEAGEFRDNVATAIVPAPGIVPVDELETSVIGAGGNIKACGTAFAGNVADKVVFAKGTYSFTATCP